MICVFLEIKTIHSKNDKEFYVLSVLDVQNVVIQKIFIDEQQLYLFENTVMFDDISQLVKFTYNAKSNSYQLALC